MMDENKQLLRGEVWIAKEDWDDWIEWFISNLTLEQQHQVHLLLHREDV